LICFDRYYKPLIRTKATIPIRVAEIGGNPPDLAAKRSRRIRQNGPAPKAPSKWRRRRKFFKIPLRNAEN